MNRFGGVGLGFSLVNLEVFMANRPSQQLIHGIFDQTSAFLFILGRCVRLVVDCYCSMLFFRDFEREYLGFGFGVHLLVPSTTLAVTFRGVIPPRPEKERKKNRVSEQSQERQSDKTHSALTHAP
jgi:hypothetical protein